MPPRPTFIEAAPLACAGDVGGIVCEEASAAESGGLGKQVRSAGSEESTCWRTEVPSETSTVMSMDDLLGPQPKLRFRQTESKSSRFGVLPMSSRPSYEDLLIRGDVHQRFVLGRHLGAGSFGSVRQAVCRRTGKAFALKVVKLEEGRGSKDVDNEIKVQSEFDHPNIVKLCGFYREAALRCIVMELCEGGDLRAELDEYVRVRREAEPDFASGLPSPVAAGYMMQALTAVAYLHHHGFIHRDIKPSNFLIAGTGQNKVLKLADFGYACRVDKYFGRPMMQTRRVGTWQYKAPEVHEGCYDQRADVWSLGVTCFRVCTDQLPFAGESREEYVEHVLEGAVDPLEAAWEGHLPQLRRLAMDMLTRNFKSRPCTRKLLSTHTWLMSYSASRTFSL